MHLGEVLVQAKPFVRLKIHPRTVVGRGRWRRRRLELAVHVLMPVRDIAFTTLQDVLSRHLSVSNALADHPFESFPMPHGGLVVVGVLGDDRPAPYSLPLRPSSTSRNRHTMRNRTTSTGTMWCRALQLTNRQPGSPSSTNQLDVWRRSRESRYWLDRDASPTVTVPAPCHNPTLRLARVLGWQDAHHFAEPSPRSASDAQ